MMRLRSSLVFAALAATVSAANAETTLREVWEGDLRVVDPHAKVYITRNFANHVYDNLIVRGLDNEFKPQMLEGWEASDDGLTYTFTLRDGLQFHDGSPVTSADSVASINRWASKNWAGGLLLDRTASMDVVDDKVFTITLKEKFPHIIRILALDVYVIPERLAMTDAATPLTEVMGSGPFKMDVNNWVPGNRMHLSRNENYVPREDAPDGLAGAKNVNIDGIDIITMQDQETRYNALTQGEIDFVQALSFDYLPLIETDPNIVIDTNDGRLAKLGVMITNHLQPPFNDVRARKAVQYAIDSAEIMTALGLPEQYQLPECRSIFSCGDNAPYAMREMAEDVTKPDIEKAKQLLAESGYNGEPIVLVHTTNIRNFDIASTVVEDQLRRVGFNVQVEGLEWNAVIPKVNMKEPVSNGGWSLMVMHSDVYDLIDPLTNSYVNRNCTEHVSGFFCNDKITALQGELLASQTEEELVSIAEELQREFSASAEMIIWGQYMLPATYNKKITNMPAAGMPVNWEVKVTE